MPVSCDSERDRKVKELDELISICDVVFTNSSQLGDYLTRLNKEWEEKEKLQPLIEPNICFEKVDLDADATNQLSKAIALSQNVTRQHF